jgi:hypothetical protein
MNFTSRQLSRVVSAGGPHETLQDVSAWNNIIPHLQEAGVVDAQNQLHHFSSQSMSFTTPHDELGPISTRRPRPSCAIMMNANGGSRPADEDEAVPLLAPDHSQPPRCPNNSTRRPVWFQRLLCVYHAARRTAPQLININVLWIFAPLGLTSGALHWNSISTSIFNFLAIIPLSAAVSDASDKLSDAFGDLLGALINATFGNAVELIVILHFLPEFS